LLSPAAATCYIELIIKEADNNVKLIVLGRFDELRQKHEKVLDDLVMEILRVLSRYGSITNTHISLC
jgi:coatomer subunit beta